jgi:hypothetical protein
MAVESHVAASVAFEKLDSSLLQEFGRGYYVRGFCIPA